MPFDLYCDASPIVHTPSASGEGVLSSDIGGSRVGVEGADGMGERERVNACGLVPNDVPDVGDDSEVECCKSEMVGWLLPEGRRRGCPTASVVWVASAGGLLPQGDLVI